MWGSSVALMQRVIDPRGGDHRVLGVPRFGERFELAFGVVAVNGREVLLEVLGDLLHVLVGHEPQARADLVHVMPTST